jgi:hypothetical protein
VVEPLSLPEGVCVGVPEPDAVPDLVGEPVEVALAVPVAVLLAESETLGVIEELAPRVTEGVAVFDSDELSVGVDEGVSELVDVGDEVPDTVPVCDRVSGGLDVAVSDTVELGEDENDGDGVELAEPPRDRVDVGVAETVEETLDVVDPLSLPVGL